MTVPLDLPGLGTIRLPARFTPTSAPVTGGQSQVVRLHDAKMRRDVALKVFAAPRDDTVRDLFRAEVSALLELSGHPHVVTLYDYEEDEEHLLLFLEYCDGGSLVGSTGWLPVVDVVTIGAHVADGLAAAHARGIVHRDIKPGNLLRSKGIVKIADFGIAMLAETDHVAAGTDRFRAPETRSGGRTGPASDIYSLAVTILELAGTSTATLLEPDEADRTKVSAAESLLSDDLQRVRELLRRMLDPDPTRRPDATTVAADFRVALDQTPTATPAPLRPTPIPTPPAGFIGRDAERDRLAALLTEHRMVTVIGPGGIGKTSLALDVASAPPTPITDGVRFADLSSIEDPDLVPSVVAAATGVRETAGATLQDSLATALASREMLLVLDNCEHVREAVADLCEHLLMRCDELQLLATSREALGVADEYLVPLAPLSTPDSETSEREIAHSESVRLLVERARQVAPDFTVAPETLPTIARIVNRLDGIPLAIELAAARIDVLGADQLLRELDDRFRILVSDTRRAARQASLHAAVEWSYRLLGENEQRVFRALSLFPGPFSLEAAEAVAGPAAREATIRLVHCSLLNQPRPGPDRRSRYSMLETLRAYGAEQLGADSESDVFMTAMTQWALTLAEATDEELATSAGEAAATVHFDAEQATLHHALDWALANDSVSALRLAISLSRWWGRRSHPSGYALLSRAVEAADHTEAALAKSAQYWLGILSRHGLHRALEHYDAALEIARELPVDKTVVEIMLSRAWTLANLDRGDEATNAVQQCLALARDHSLPCQEMDCLTLLAVIAFYAEDAEAGRQWADQACAVDASSCSGALIRGRAGITAEAYRRVGDGITAERLFGELLRAAEAIGDRFNISFALEGLANGYVETGRFAEAAGYLNRALKLDREDGRQDRMVDMLHECGRLCQGTARFADALTLFAATERQEQALDLIDMAEWREDRAACRDEAVTRLSPEQIQTAERRGQLMPFAAAVEFALTQTEDALAAEGRGPLSTPLSPTERELITLVANGKTDNQIASELSISVRTVRSHLDRIRHKTGARRRAGITRLALEAGLV